MSAHYALCVYDDATGSYIPPEVRPITDDLKKDDPLYQEGFQAGAASRDAEVNDWRSQAHRSQSEADNAIAGRDQLREQVALLRKGCTEIMTNTCEKFPG